jgi:hypothetical protein
MKVQEVLINDKKRYLLIDGDNKPVFPVLRFLKYLDNIGKAENTLKSYCHYLKFYFQFLNEKEKEFKEVDLDLLAEYISWLRSPYQSTKVVQFQQTKARRSERTVNTMLTCVQSFYDYLMRIEDYEKDLSEKTKNLEEKFLHLQKIKFNLSMMRVAIFEMLYWFEFCMKGVLELVRHYLYGLRTLILALLPFKCENLRL